MDYRHLGRTGLRVSPLCLGTMNFGPQTSEEDSYAVMDAAHDAGLNFFDTADVYGWKTGEGVTEQIIGRWFARGGDRREKTVIATKLYGGMGDWPNETFLSALAIRRKCEASLRRLQTDHIDLYQMHHLDLTLRGMSSGRPSTSSRPRARSSTSDPRTSPAGVSPRRTSRPPAGALSAWYRSRVTTTSCSARSSWRSSRPARHTASASFPGRR